METFNSEDADMKLSDLYCETVDWDREEVPDGTPIGLIREEIWRTPQPIFLGAEACVVGVIRLFSLVKNAHEVSENVYYAEVYDKDCAMRHISATSTSISVPLAEGLRQIEELLQECEKEQPSPSMPETSPETPSNDLTFEDYQREIKEISKYPNRQQIGNPADVLHIAVGMGGESGEVLNEINQALSIHHDGLGHFKNMSKKRRKNVIEELGDLLWYSTTLATLLSIPLDDVVRFNMDKITKKQERIDRERSKADAYRSNNH